MARKGFVEIKSVIMVVLTLIVFILVFESCTTKVEEQEGLACWTALNAQKLGVQALTGSILSKACTTIQKPLIDADVATPEGIKHEVAMNMARAWKITHEGTIEKEMWKDSWTIFRKGQECMILYQLEFRPTPLFETTYPGVTYEAMRTYFAEEYFASFPRKDGKEGNLRYSFGEYVQSKGGEGIYWFVDESENDDLSDEVIKPGRVYAVSVASGDSTIFGLSGFPKTGTNILIFSEYNYAIQELGCRAFAK